MAIQRAHPYAGTRNIQAAYRTAIPTMPRVSTPIAQVGHQIHQTRAGQKAGFQTQRWVFVVFLFIIFIMMLYFNAELNNETSRIAREIDLHYQDIAVAQREIAELDVKLSEAADEMRIRSRAQNKLGMKEPREEQIHYFQASDDAAVIAENDTENPEETMSLFRLLMSTVGL